MKYIIDNLSDLPDENALLYVRDVIAGGLISNDGKQHCYATTFTNHNNNTRVLVLCWKNAKSEKFIIYTKNIN